MENNLFNFHVREKINLKKFKIIYRPESNDCIALNGFGFGIHFYIQIIKQNIITGSQRRKFAPQCIRLGKIGT